MQSGGGGCDWIGSGLKIAPYLWGFAIRFALLWTATLAALWLFGRWVLR